MRLGTALILTTLGAGIAGCGSSDDDKPSTSSGGTTSTGGATSTGGSSSGGATSGGGTGGRGHRLSGAYGISRQWHLEFTWFIDNRAGEKNLQDRGGALDYDRFFIDTVFKY